MKILFLSQGLPFPIYRDGLTVRVYHLLKELTKKHECHLIAFEEYELSKAETQELRKLCSCSLIPYYPKKNIFNTFKKIIFPNRYTSQSFENEVMNKLTTFSPDIVIAEQTFMAQYINLFKEIPSIISAVDAISLAALRQAGIKNNFLHKLTWRYIAWQRLYVEKKYLKEFNAISLVSEDDASFLRKKIGADITVIPNGVDVDFFSPKLKESTLNSVVFTGNLSAPMNEAACLYLIEEVYPLIHSMYPELTLVIAGRQATEKIKERLPVYVDLMEDLPDIRTALKNAKLYLCPIVYGTGIKNTVLQALAMGIPVITTALIAEPIQIEDNKTGIIANYGDDFIVAVKKALGQPEEIKKIGMNARRHIEAHYSWQAVAGKYLDLV